MIEHELNSSTINMIADKIDSTVGEVVKIIALKSWTSLVYKTPVGNPDLWETNYVPAGYAGGQAKFSWNINYNKPDRTTPTSWSDGIPSTPEIQVRNDYSDAYVTSSIPYMLRLEEGHSTQGMHMIKRTVSELKFEINNI